MAEGSEDTRNGARPEFSVIIPVYNEAKLMKHSVRELREALVRFERPFEIILAENGSQDGTAAIAEKLSEKLSQVKSLSLPEPNYGRALREGIIRSAGELVLCDEIDLCDANFHSRSIEMLRSGGCDMVIGSKLAPGSSDERPFYRHLVSHVMSFLLRVLFGFKGTDTHGLKAFRRDRLMPVVDSCVTDKDLFASEMVIRAQRTGLRVVEIPVCVREKRRPSINLFKRVPNVLKNLARLYFAIRMEKKRRGAGRPDGETAT